jgi:ribosomal-protein-alanine N-acetyltransferase
MQDIYEVHSIFSDPQVISDNTYDSLPTTLVELAKIIKHHQQNKYSLWAVIDKPTNKIIGSVGFKPEIIEKGEEPEISVIFYFTPDYWGLGLATEAVGISLKYIFTKLKLKQIIGVTLPEHQAARRVMEKNGMKFIRDIVLDKVNQVLYKITDKQYQEHMGGT